ncbi:MAG TPA: arginine deiminase family protein [Rhodothermales bacterium]|nr:arginine deiminase family protein [Rhodothermales bacterium]
MLYRTLAEVDFKLDDLPPLPRPTRVLMTTPEFFEVQYVINPHMEGNVGAVDPAAAVEEWDAIRRTYESIGVPVSLVPGAEDLLDMVFCANQTLPYLNPASHERGVVLSRMHAEQRLGEVPHYERFFEQQGYAIRRLSEEKPGDFEGMGDAIWHESRYLLWGGYGFRSSLDVYEQLSRDLNVHVLALRLEDPDFYHLDTCFSILNDQTVLIYPGALQPEGIELIQHFFARVIEAPEDEARRLFACNAHCPDGHHVLIQKGCTETNRMLNEAGFEPMEVDTSEFLKAGGSVFCMKQMYW